MDLVELGDHINTFRKANGSSQAQLAQTVASAERI